MPPGWVIFAAGNRHGDGDLPHAMPAPLANRFTHYGIVPELEARVAWAHHAGIDPAVVAFLRFHPELLFEFDPARTPGCVSRPAVLEVGNPRPGGAVQLDS